MGNGTKMCSFSAVCITGSSPEGRDREILKKLNKICNRVDRNRCFSFLKIRHKARGFIIGQFNLSIF
jgi:hypothetical protein